MLISDKRFYHVGGEIDIARHFRGNTMRRRAIWTRRNGWSAPKAPNPSRCSRSLFPLHPPEFLQSAGWKTLLSRSLFKDWQAAHDNLAITLAKPG